MNKGLSDYLRNNSRSLESDYVDLPALRDDLLGLKSALKVERTALNSHPNERQERLSNIDDVKMLIGKVDAAIELFPSYPELPPTRPLEKISGVIEFLTIRKVIGYFDFSEYTSLKEQAKRKQERDNAGAVLVMMTQSLAGSVIHSRINDGERKKYQCVYIEGVISGKKFSGWLGKTNVQAGDKIEMAVMPDGDNNILYALANPQQRTISMFPGGVIGLGNLSLLKAAKVAFIFFFVLFFLFIWLALDHLLGMLIAYFTISSIVSVVIHHGAVRDKKPQCLLFEEICEVLAIPGGHELDLMYFTEKKVEELKMSGDWISPENRNVVLPQEKAKSHGDFFYYY